MNDRYDGYDQQNYELVGYDEFGQPVYRPVQQAPSYEQNSPYGYGYDPYAGGQPQPQPQQQAPSYDPYGGGAPQQAPPQAQQTRQTTGYIPQQAAPPGPPSRPQGPPPERDYRTEQFQFVEEPDEDSEDVIDWLKFTESRTERREEARRRSRNRGIALVVVLALCLVGGAGYLWYQDKLPFLSKESGATGAAAATGPQNRDVIVVHLHNTKGGGTSTALLVNNTTTKRATTVLLPNSLALSDEDGTSTTLAKSVDDDGSSGTSDSLDTLLGTDIQGTWRLDTPYLNNLVELVGNIDVTTNTTVPDPAKKGTVLVHKGADQTLSGQAAVAYATYRAKGEPQTAQLERFGQVMQGVLRKLSSDPQAATTTVQTLAQILDPSLTEKDLGAFLAKLADRAKEGDYKSEVLPVQRGGAISESTANSVVENVLGGAVKSPAEGGSLRVGIKNATGDKARTEKARVALVNGGYTFVSGGTGTAVAASRVTYADAAHKKDAVEVAKTLGLPASAVTKGQAARNADVSVVLGQNYSGR
ncbi:MULTISPECIES: LCP family protein [unclassified Streptomyces]|uniref:LCP family protein n=1 Tax=unclassified Streptomyces TaxID=2593676 RepID=UPI00278C44CE|nr:MULTISPECIES: LCP family protein [unclassified Streptomyces]